MKILLVTPAPPGTHFGNRMTALRWARILRSLGHRASIVMDYAGQPCDALVALHAKRSYPAAAHFRSRHPGAPLVVALTGTDVYQDLPRNDLSAKASLQLADRLVGLHHLVGEHLPPAARAKLRVIVQSAQRPRTLPPKNTHGFQVAVVGHLRPVKAPLLTAEAVRDLPTGSRLKVVHAGDAMEEALAGAARAEMSANPRYRWLGELAPWQARRLIARSQVMVLSSRSEGGANVVGEAVTVGTPVLASAIPGSQGLLGLDYPGYFPVDDAPALRELLLRCEGEPGFLSGLERRVALLAAQFTLHAETEGWRALLAELAQ